MLIRRTRTFELIEKIRAVHPYEEMAYDVYPVEHLSPDVGLGRVGQFDPPISWETLIQRLKQDVEAPSVRVSGVIPRIIERRRFAEERAVA